MPYLCNLGGRRRAWGIEDRLLAGEGVRQGDDRGHVEDQCDTEHGSLPSPGPPRGPVPPADRRNLVKSCHHMGCAVNRGKAPTRPHVDAPNRPIRLRVRHRRRDRSRVFEQARYYPSVARRYLLLLASIKTITSHLRPVSLDGDTTAEAVPEPVGIGGGPRTWQGWSRQMVTHARTF